MVRYRGIVFTRVVVLAFMVFPLTRAVGQPTAPPTLTDKFHSPSFQERRAALTLVMNSPNWLGESAVQRELISALRSQSTNTKWDGLQEDSVEYEQYYGDLLNIVCQVATKYHSPAAWSALAAATYNDDSTFAKWLSLQPEALPSLMELTKSKDKFNRSTALFVLAEGLGSCENPKEDKGCRLILSEKEQVLATLRDHLGDADDRLSAVRGLGICGDERDIERLQQLKRITVIDPWFARYVDLSIEQIKNRFDTSAGNNPRPR